MAIFENSFQNKAIVDDTEKLTCTVENTQNIDKHTEYVLRVQRGPSKDNKWTVSRRYRDFAALHSSLQQSNIELSLPPKKLIGNMQPSFIAERQIALQNYINEVLKHPILALSLQVRSFLDPNNYSLSIAEQALQTVSIALRGDGHYDLKGPLADIGWRIHKHYFLVTNTEHKVNYLLSWQNYGPDRYLSDKELQTAFKSLQCIDHPHIDQPITIQNLESGVYVVRRIYENGSVRDLLYGTEYTKNHLAKYGNPKVRKPFTTGQIAHYGYQVLLALKFLNDKGIPHGHIHPGNIAIDSQRAVLIDIENFLTGVPSLYRPYLLELKRRHSLEAIDVYCFGRTLYEMATGRPLDTPYCQPDSFPEGISESLESILTLCLSPSKHGGPPLKELLGHPLFTRAALSTEVRGVLKVPLATKVAIATASTQCEGRLRNEQKLVRSTKREVRIQEILNSEEELKKQKKKMKKRESLYKSSSSLAETVASRSVSTASSPTPPQMSGETSGNSSYTAPAVSPDGRSALLDSICAFDKRRLTRVQAH